MLEREKVIRGLKCHSAHGYEMCFDCPYYTGPDDFIYKGDDDLEGVCCEEKLASDALALLKEQDEGIEPEISRKSVTETTVSLWYKCGACGGAIEQGDDEFCRHCGKKVKWDD